MLICLLHLHVYSLIIVNRRNLGLDLGAYIQGKSFTRSVSISEATSAASAASDSGDTASPYLVPGSGRFASGGGPGSQPSPSPLSSATATISPDSPVPFTISSLFPPASVSQSVCPSVALSTAPSTRDPMIAVSPQSSSAANTPVLEPLPCCSNSTNCSNVTKIARASNPYTAEFNSLFQNPITHRTVTLLSHLVDSRLSPEWREVLLNWTTSSIKLASESPPVSLPSVSHQCVDHHTSTPVDATDSSLTRRAVPPTLSPLDDIATVKRFRHNNDGPEVVESTAVTPVHSQLKKTRSEPRPTCGSSSPESPTFISLRLVTTVCSLADHFESRYRDKLGDLLEDVARLSTSSVGDDSNGPSTYNLSNTADDGTVSQDVVDVNRRIISAARNRFHHVLRELFTERINWGRVIAMLAFVRALCEHVENSGGESAHSSGTSRLSQATSPSNELNTDTDCSAESTGTTTVTHRPLVSDAQTQPSSQTLTTPEDQHAPRSIGTPQLPSVSTAVDAIETTGGGLHAAHYVAWTAEFIHGSHGIWYWISANGGWDGLITFEAERGLRDSAHGAGDRLVVGITEDEAMGLLRRAVTGVATLAVGAVGLVAAIHFFSKRL
ncbi:hypothetical protein EG68_02756 [Paragonimus skrjabini miyazakii]|uniref:Bcl-2 Bcl-2 homology region 1-3 domain-containing protein n=1 Tax=Paragonimus skrjabini miyazakii TaxID=59628 RepID=A0A8S9YXY6_9TREM|nr:hypothetical protein EG68_02756 [Paragonimus skrjabini miyazakii]